jgi:hypothetical protein
VIIVYLWGCSFGLLKYSIVRTVGWERGGSLCGVLAEAGRRADLDGKDSVQHSTQYSTDRNASNDVMFICLR